MSTLTYPEMIVVGLLQGVTELFPISSLGHSVLVPALLRGNWATDLDMSTPGSPYLDTLVAMHVATAAALVIFFWRDWVRLIRAFLESIRDRQIATTDQRLAWLLVVGTIPVGLAGLALDKLMRDYLGKPVPSALFLTANGLVLIVVERLHRRSRAARTTEANMKGHPTQAAGPFADTIKLPAVTDSATHEPRPPARSDQSHNESGDESSDAELAQLGWGEAITIGACQALALLPRNQPLRSDYRWWTGARPVPPRRGSVRVPTSHPCDRGRRAAQASRACPPGNAQRDRPYPGRQPGRRNRRVPLGTLSHPLLPNPQPQPIRDLLHSRRPRIVGLPHVDLKPAP
jgi:undecaprenyl pyrophosphate phosphatase UppP